MYKNGYQFGTPNIYGYDLPTLINIHDEG